MNADEHIVLAGMNLSCWWKIRFRESRKKSSGMCREDGGLKVSSAVGWAEGPGSQIKTIVREADERMYEDKVRSKQGR